MDRPEGFIETPPELRERTRRQQASVPYLGLGHRVTAIPDPVYGPLRDLWRTGRRRAVVEGGDGYKSSLAEPSLVLQDAAHSEATLERLRPAMESWYGAPLLGSAAYGLRIYRRGAFLHSHVDRTETHVISATLCIDYALERPWPLYLKTRDEEELFVHLTPGQMLLYESAILEHGRPVPLDGEYYVGMFVHYRPVDWSFPDVG